MEVVCLSLWPGVSLTLIREAEHWRFGAWSRRFGEPIAEPSEADRARVFPSFGDAAEFFRAICPRDLPTPASVSSGEYRNLDT